MLAKRKIQVPPATPFPSHSCARGGEGVGQGCVWLPWFRGWKHPELKVVYLQQERALLFRLS